jgi:signal transduction histidine kinase
MEPIINPTPVPIPNRRKLVRRAEDILKMRHTDALESLLSDLAFEVRNLLIPVPALTEELREEIGKIVEASTQERQEFRERWSSGLNFLNDHAQRLIDRTKQVRLHTQASQCPIKTLVEGVLEIWGTIAEKKGIFIRCQGLESLPTILAYEWRLSSVFFTVISRAIHVTQSGGSVTVSGRLDQSQGIAIVEVKDTGPGVALQLCEAFNRGEELDVTEIAASNAWHMYELQGARKIAETHGGRISIETSREAGTKYSICFPVT